MAFHDFSGGTYKLANEPPKPVIGNHHSANAGGYANDRTSDSNMLVRAGQDQMPLQMPLTFQDLKSNHVNEAQDSHLVNAGGNGPMQGAPQPLSLATNWSIAGSGHNMRSPDGVDYATAHKFDNWHIDSRQEQHSQHQFGTRPHSDSADNVGNANTYASNSAGWYIPERDMPSQHQPKAVQDFTGGSNLMTGAPMAPTSIFGSVPNSHSTNAGSSATDYASNNSIIHAIQQEHQKLLQVLEEMSRRQAEHEERVAAMVSKNAAGKLRSKNKLKEKIANLETKMALQEKAGAKKSPQERSREIQAKGDASASTEAFAGTQSISTNSTPSPSHLESEAKLKVVKKQMWKLGGMGVKLQRGMTMLEGKALRARLKTFLNHPAVDTFIALIIVSNTVFIAAQADYTAVNLVEPVGGTWQAINLGFLLFFTCECFIRLIIEQEQFILGRNKYWNVFDTCVLVISAIEEIVSMNSSARALRVLRTLRLMRVARFLRVLRFFHELRAMVMGILHSFSTLMWVLLLLIMNMFLFAVYVTPTVAYERMEIRDGKTVDEEYNNALKEQFGSLATTMYSLYKAVTGGDDWSLYGNLLFKIDPFPGLFFCFYIAFTIFAVLNVISGVFIGNAFKLIDDDTHLSIMEQTESRTRMIAAVKNVFLNADTDRSGKISREEFNAHMEDPCVQAYLRQLGLEIEAGRNWAGLFDLIDFDDSGELELEEFVSGCLHLQGQASSLDIERCNYTLRHIRNEMGAFIDLIVGQKEELLRMGTATRAYDDLLHARNTASQGRAQGLYNYHTPELQDHQHPQTFSNIHCLE